MGKIAHLMRTTIANLKAEQHEKWHWVAALNAALTIAIKFIMGKYQLQLIATSSWYLQLPSDQFIDYGGALRACSGAATLCAERISVYTCTEYHYSYTYSPSTTPYDKNCTAISIVTTVKLIKIILTLQRNNNSISNHILIIQYSLLPVYCPNEAFIVSIPHTDIPMITLLFAATPVILGHNITEHFWSV